MIRKVIVGVNSTGKSEYLINMFNIDENSKKLLVPTEVLLDEEVKSSNKIKGTFVIDNILPIIYEKIDIDMNEKKENLKSEISTAIGSVDNSIVKKFKFNDTWNYDKMLENTIKEEFKTLGSGDKNKYILEMLNELDIYGYNLYIDEPEKFAHPTLQIEIASIINKLAVRNEIFLVTHSPLIVKHLEIERLSDIFIFKDNGEFTFSDQKLKEILSLINDRNSTPLFDSSTNKFNKIEYCVDFLNINYDEYIKYYFLDLYKELIFYSKVVFVEDINTKYYIDGITKQLNNKVETMNVGGKVPLLVWAKVAESINTYYSIVYDSDQILKYNQNDEYIDLIDANDMHKQYNDILCGLNSKEITVDIEFSTLGFPQHNVTGNNALLKSQMNEIKSRKTRIDTRLKIKKAAENSVGYDYLEIKSFLNNL